MSDGARKLGTYPPPYVQIRCDRCPRYGRYALAKLIKRFGPRCRSPL